jgi:hypothetical protein
MRAERTRIRTLQFAKESKSIGDGVYGRGQSMCSVRGDDRDLFTKASGCVMAKTVSIIHEDCAHATQLQALREMVHKVGVVDMSRQYFEDRLKSVTYVWAAPKLGDEDVRGEQKWPGTEGRTIVEASDAKVLKAAIRVYRKYVAHNEQPRGLFPRTLSFVNATIRHSSSLAARSRRFCSHPHLVCSPPFDVQSIALCS